MLRRLRSEAFVACVVIAFAQGCGSCVEEPAAKVSPDPEPLPPGYKPPRGSKTMLRNETEAATREPVPSAAPPQ